MSTAFSRTLRSLDADGFRRPILGLLLVSALLVAWMAWFCFARVALYEVTDTARLEVNWAVHPVESPVAGRVVATRLVLGQDARVGDVLVELDADAQKLQLQEEKTRFSALSPQIAVLQSEVAAEEQAQEEDRQAGRVALEQAKAQHEEASATAQFAEEEAARIQRLHREGIVAEIDRLRSQSEAQRRKAAAEALRLAITRLDWDRRTRESSRKALIERLRNEINQLQGQKTTSAATLERLKNDIDKRRISAPVTGRLADVSPLRIGAFVREGDKLGTVVSAGELKAIAEFLPSSALGRIHPGQPARLRLEGFPWAQYGSIPAKVESVAAEVRNGRVRVELAIEPVPLSTIPLQHGLPGTAEVEVERASPATLVLRAAGKLLGAPRTGTGAAEGHGGTQ